MVDVGLIFVTFGGPGASILVNLGFFWCPGSYPWPPEPGRVSKTASSIKKPRKGMRFGSHVGTLYNAVLEQKSQSRGPEASWKNIYFQTQFGSPRAPEHHVKTWEGHSKTRFRQARQMRFPSPKFVKHLKTVSHIMIVLKREIVLIARG